MPWLSRAPAFCCRRTTGRSARLCDPVHPLADRRGLRTSDRRRRAAPTIRADVVASFADRAHSLVRPAEGARSAAMPTATSRSDRLGANTSPTARTMTSWLPDHLARLTATLDASGCDWGYSRPLWVARDGFIFPFAVDLTQADQLDNFLHRTNTIPSSSVLHRRDALERVGYWPEDVPRVADWRCWQQIILRSSTGTAAYCPVPTVLHFRAHWKTEEGGLEQRLRAIAESAPWWPRACRIPVAPGVAEQQTAFAAIQSNPVAWVEDLRRGVVEVTDRLAWGWVFTPNAKLAGPASAGRRSPCIEREESASRIAPRRWLDLAAGLRARAHPTAHRSCGVGPPRKGPKEIKEAEELAVPESRSERPACPSLGRFGGADMTGNDGEVVGGAAKTGEEDRVGAGHEGLAVELVEDREQGVGGASRRDGRRSRRGGSPGSRR